MARDDTLPRGRARRVLASLGDRVTDLLEELVDPAGDQERRGTYPPAGQQAADGQAAREDR